MYATVPISRICTGAVLDSPIYDEKKTMLLAAGLTVTDALLKQIRKRGIRSVLVETHDLPRVYRLEPQGASKKALPDRRRVINRVETSQSRRIDAELAAIDDLTVGPQTDPFSLEIGRHDTAPYDQENQGRFVEEHEESLHLIKQLTTSLAERHIPDLAPLETISRDALKRIAADKDLFVCMGVNPYYADYPGRHSLHTASLAMAMGATLGFDERTLMELAMGCLVHDLGMTRLDPRTYQTHRRLTNLEFLEITKHPLYTFEMLEQSSSYLPAVSRMVAYQTHERCDGSGYPRGRTATQIHDLAKVAAVADTFVALVSPRPHRPGLLPYYAMEKVLEGVRTGLYDPIVVRALLETACLFPIGSYVELDDGRIGKVLRANGQHYDRPILEVWHRDHLNQDPIVLDLAKEFDYSVKRPLERIT